VTGVQTCALPISGSIIKKSSFDHIGGFLPIRHEGDIDLWLRLAAQYPTLKLQPSLVWWRVHPNQEHQKRKNKNLNFHTNLRALLAEECPLNEEERKRAIALIRKRSVRNILNMGLKKGHIQLATEEYKKSKHTTMDFFKALR
jgi:hypothetical protein